MANMAVLEKFSNASIELKEHVASPLYHDLDRRVTHDRLTAKAQSGEKVDENMLENIRKQIESRIFAVNKDDPQEYKAQHEAFTNVVWPMLYESARKNLGMTMFLHENGMHSDFVAKFLYNVPICPAKAVLPAHGVSDTLSGKPAVVPPTDPMYGYLWDQSYRMIQERTAVPQEALKEAGTIFFAGGGLLPELWTNGYPIGINGQKYVVYDRDAEVTKPYLEQILGGELEEFNIDYRNVDYREAFHDPEQRGVYDCVVANGVEAYAIKAKAPGSFDTNEFDSDMRGFYGLLKSDGSLFFDLQLYHPVLVFDLAVLNWPKGMTVIPSYDLAAGLIVPIVRSAGFNEIQHRHEPVNGALGETPAGLIVQAYK